MRKIGIVASGASETSASVILNVGEEGRVKAEDIVLIDNKIGNKILAVCRGGLGRNENLKTGYYSPGVAYAKSGRTPSTAKEFYEFKLSVIGDVTGSLEQNRTVISPSSEVDIFEEGDDPMRLLGSSKFALGYYKEHPGWRVPINEKFLSYHIGVFGVTGSGKSFLARYEVIPILNAAGYDVLVFDWKGSDYGPFYAADRVVSLRDVHLDEEVVTQYLISRMDHFGFTGERKYVNDIVAAMEDVISDDSWRKMTPTQFKEFLGNKAIQILENENRDRQGNVGHYGRMYIRRLERGLRRLQIRDIENILGMKNPENILELVRKNHVVVIDVSEGSRDEKLSIFLAFSRYLRSLMEKKRRLNLALLIDEAPQYTPFEPVGIQHDTTQMITELCALGRTYGLCIVLLSQGIAGEIGINAAVRRNLNTQFIGKIHPLDMQEASALLLQLDIDPRFLVSLPEGHFYFLGKLNPSPVPLLISFKIEEEDADVESGRRVS